MPDAPAFAPAFATELRDRLVRYCAVDTQSDETSESQPSTAIQLDLLNMLVAELEEIGAAEVRMTDYGAVLATVPATTDRPAPTIAWCAHVDTAPAFNAAGVKPVVHAAWDGGAIRFADDPDLALTPEASPYLGGKVGDDIITASGRTLLGADDKAGVAIIMAAARHLLSHPEIPHGPIRLCFTPDEEIGRGVDPRLPGDLGADFAYTLDGAEVGDIEYETFSADGAVITIEGVSTHTATAKGRMVNALHLAARIVSMLPQATLTPETTDGRQGFIHVYEIKGTAAAAEVKAILRDFELDGLATLGELLNATCAVAQAGEPRARIACAIRPQYRNMRYWLEKDMAPVDLALAAYRATEIEPKAAPIRGGTDGSRLTEMGVPCPNLFTGMQMIHGPLEWISAQDMETSARMLLNLAELAAQEAQREDQPTRRREEEVIAPR